MGSETKCLGNVQLCDCCLDDGIKRPATKRISLWPNASGSFLSCDECNPGSEDPLRENGLRDEALARARQESPDVK